MTGEKSLVVNESMQRIFQILFSLQMPKLQVVRAEGSGVGRRGISAPPGKEPTLLSLQCEGWE